MASLLKRSTSKAVYVMAVVLIVLAMLYLAQHSEPIRYSRDIRIDTDSSNSESTLVMEQPPIDSRNDPVISKDDKYLTPPSQEWMSNRASEVRSFVHYSYTPPSNFEPCATAYYNLHIYFYPKINVVLSVCPKSGCTHWKEAMLRAEGRLEKPLSSDQLVRIHYSHGDTRLANVKTFTEMNKATSIVVMRNPWTRMVSGYVDKLGPDSDRDHGMRAYGINIVSQNRNIEKSEVEEQDLYPTFEEYLRWLVAHEGNVDVHFTHQYKQLCLKNADYDYFVPLEYASVEFPGIMAQIDPTIQLRGSYDAVSDPRLSNSTALAREWFKRVDRSLIDQLYTVFKPDFMMANYSNFTDPEFPLPIF